MDFSEINTVYDQFLLMRFSVFKEQDFFFLINDLVSNQNYLLWVLSKL